MSCSKDLPYHSKKKKKDIILCVCVCLLNPFSQLRSPHVVTLSVDTPGRLPGCSLVAGEMLLDGKPFSPSPLVILPGFVCFHWACAARPGSLCPPVADRGCSGRCTLWVHPATSCPRTSPFAHSISFVAVTCIWGLLPRVSPGHFA